MDRFREMLFCNVGRKRMIAVESSDFGASGLTAQTTAVTVRAADAAGKEMPPEQRAEFERALDCIERFPREFGWLMIYVGVLGIVLPGIVGFPLVIAGGAVLMPSGRKSLSRWVSRHPKPLVLASLKQIVRMADDLERRYPSKPGTPA
jgi:hypothetical protein